MKNYKKIIVGFIIVLSLLFCGKVIYSCTYIGDIVVTYPWDDYSISEKIASYLLGYGKAYTKQELYDKGLISDDQSVFRKFNKSYYE